MKEHAETQRFFNNVSPMETSAANDGGRYAAVR